MLRIFVLLGIIVALFLTLPATPAAFWSSIPFILLAVLFVEAYRRGRRLLLARKEEGKRDELFESTRLIAGLFIFHTIWVGLGHGVGAESQAMDGYGMHGGAGGDMGHYDSGGFDGGGGGGDGGGGGF